MEYSYVAYTEDRRLVKGKLSALNEEMATNLLNYGGYQVVTLKERIPFLNMEKLVAIFSRIKPREIILFSRQLALLLESGTDIVTSLDLLQSQATTHKLKKIIGEVASDIRSGSSMSQAMSKHPMAFSTIYHRAVAAGEQGGNLEIVLRYMADYIERAAIAEKKIKSALTYPFIVVMAAIVVISLLVYYVFPVFANLYRQFEAELPLATRLLVMSTEWLNQYGLYIVGVVVAVAAFGYFYIKTPNGKYQWDKFLLRMPIIGRILHLNELSRTCLTIALLFRAGVALPEIMSLATHGTSNKVMIEAMTEVQRDLLRGEGLSQPMAKRKIFLPLMVQMTGVGEETGNLDNTLTTVAQSYETEADDRTSSAVGLIQPVVTVFIGLFVGFIAISLISAMYSIFGQVG